MRSHGVFSLGLVMAFAAGCSAGTDAAPAAHEANLATDKMFLDRNVFSRASVVRIGKRSS